MIEGISEWADKLKATNKAIVVEGIKDEEALSSLGAKNIFTLKKPLYAVVEGIAKQYNEVIILTDFDKKGKELHGKLKKGFERNGVKVDIYFREFLQKNTHLSHIEGLKTYLNK